MDLDNYLRRKAGSFDITTKCLIPFYTVKHTVCIGVPRILDVGVGDGVLAGSGIVAANIRSLLPNAVIDGIELRESILENIPDGIYNNMYIVLMEDFNPTVQYDVIIFSSVLHEIGSYSQYNKFTVDPIKDAVRKAAKLLNSGGIIIIRDGLDEPLSVRKEIVKPIFHSSDDLEAFKYFCKIKGEDYIVLSDGDYTVCKTTRGVLRDFLCTWTWCRQSGGWWNRELNKHFCYMPYDTWTAVIKGSGFELITGLQSYEEYIQYFKKIVSNYTTLFPIVGLFVGKKIV